VPDLAEIHRTEIGMLERGVRLPRLDTIRATPREVAPLDKHLGVRLIFLLF
jgi:hypothetical protein